MSENELLQKEVERQQRTREQQQIIREQIEEANTPTGAVTFPDHDTSRIQIVLADGEMGVDIPNALDAARSPESVQWNVVQFVNFGEDAMLVEFER